MADTTNRAFQPDPDVHITYEDQLKINLFARLNAKLDDLKAETKAKENELTNLEDASDELVLMDELEDDATIPFMSGDVFLYYSVEEAKEALEKTKAKLKADVGGFENSMKEIKEKMSDLKTQLYGKFGSHINLEGEEE